MPLISAVYLSSFVIFMLFSQWVLVLGLCGPCGKLVLLLCPRTLVWMPEVDDESGDRYEFILFIYSHDNGLIL
jgi:hypothetical protein